MKSIKLNSDNYFDIEQIIKKIAKENKLDSISKVTINLNRTAAVVKFAVIDDWDDKTFDPEMEKLPPKKKRYTIYHHGPVEMNGRGIEYIVDNEYEDKMSPDQGLEAIIEDLSSTYPEFYDYEISIYVHGDMSGLSLDVDYKPDSTPDDVVDKIQDWLTDNTIFERIGGEE